MKYRTLFIILILFSACRDADEISFLEVQTNPSIKSSLSYTIVKSNIKITLPSVCLNDYEFFFLLNDSLLFCKDGFKAPNKIDVFNINTAKYVNSITWDKAKFPFGTGSFELKDSAIILNAVSSSKYFQFGLNGDIKKSWNLLNISSIDSSTNNLYPALYPTYFSYSNPIALDEDRLIVSFIIPESFFLNEPMIDVAMVSLSQGKIIVKYKRHPDLVYAQMRASAYPEDLSFAHKTIVGDTLILSYPMDNFIYGYELGTGKLLFKKPMILSSSIVSLPQPLSRSAYNNEQDKWNFRITTPFYEPLNYHYKTNLYTRILHHGIDKETAKKKDGPLNRKLSLIIMDENFNAVGEEVFNHAHIGIYRIIPTSDGFLSLPTNNPEFMSDDFLTISRTKIIRK